MEKDTDKFVGSAPKVEFEGLPPIKKTHTATQKVPSNNLPIYVKHGFPEVFKKKVDYYDYLPKISQLPGPESEETYGLMYHKPETEAEIKMHDLWIARRRQETFEWKSQQQLALVLDRLALHKSRLESDLLRRRDSAAYLRSELSRPKSANETRPQSAHNKFAPTVEHSRKGARALSAHSRSRLNFDNLSPKHNRKKSDEGGSDEGDNGEDVGDDIYEDTGDDIQEEGGEDGDGGEAKKGQGVVLKVMKDGVETEKALTQTSRKIVKKNSKEISGGMPMRFKNSMPLSFTNEHYMQLSDSEDEGEGPKVNRASVSAPTNGSGGKPPGSTGGKKPPGPTPIAKIQFKREKLVNRERPISGAIFRTFAEEDPECKVLYRYTNYRRMPLTETQQVWLDDKEKERSKTSTEYAKKLVDDQLAKLAKSKEKGKKDGKDKGDKDKKDKDAKDSKKSAKDAKKDAALLKKLSKPKYRSASDFMEKNFPNFDRDEVEEEDKINSCGPMRVSTIYIYVCMYINLYIDIYRYVHT